MTLSLHLPDDAATAELGARIAAALRPGDIIVLQGDLGAGKSALARAIIRHRVGDADLDVPSPSFALVQPYHLAGWSILHADLYRLASARDVDELGLFDDRDAVVLLEWAERVPGLTEMADWTIALAIPPSGEGRDAQITVPPDRAF